MAAISQNTVWEVRAGGSDSACSGGYVAGSSGGSVDYSQQNAAQYSFTDLHIDASVATKVTSASHNFGAADVGNILRVIVGTAWTAGYYQIVSVASNAATLNLSPSAAGNANNATWCEGGAFATPQPALSNCVGGNRIFVQNGTYQTNQGFSTLLTGAQTRSIPFLRFCGYNSNRSDQGAGGRPTLQLITNTGKTCIDFTTVGGWIIENFIVDCNGLGTSIGINCLTSCLIRNCKVINFTSIGISCAATSLSTLIENNEVTAGTSAASFAINAKAHIFGNWVHDNACSAINQGQAGGITAFNLVTNHNTAGSIGITTSILGCPVFNNTIAFCASDGIKNASSSVTWQSTLIRGNLLSSIIGAGINASNAGAGTPADRSFDGNAFYSCTGGPRSNCDDTGSAVPINGTFWGQYTNVSDVLCTSSPFINGTIGPAGNNDFRLNNDPNGGAKCRWAGYIPMPNTAMSAFPDIGVAQSLPMLVDSGMDGGF